MSGGILRPVGHPPAADAPSTLACPACDTQPMGVLTKSGASDIDWGCWSTNMGQHWCSGGSIAEMDLYEGNLLSMTVAATQWYRHSHARLGDSKQKSPPPPSMLPRIPNASCKVSIVGLD